MAVVTAVQLHSVTCQEIMAEQARRFSHGMVQKYLWVVAPAQVIRIMEESFLIMGEMEAASFLSGAIILSEIIIRSGPMVESGELPKLMEQVVVALVVPSSCMYPITPAICL